MHLFSKNDPGSSDETGEGELESESEHSRLNPFHIFAFVYVSILICGLVLRMASQ